jgi:hypothetical protein
MARPNEADRGTDRALADLERRINSVYSQAAKELQEEIDAFFKHFADQDKKMQDLIGQKRNGKEWTEKDYQQWRLNQMGRGKRLETLRDKLAERATEAKEVALAYVNDATPGIYSLNRNYTAYTIESVHPSADFTLFDEQTVKRLIVEQPDVMPYYPERLALKRGIDLAFGKQQITASVTGSILQGRSIKQISDDLQSRIVTMSRVSAIRAARTAVTAAQNAGRMDSYAAADEMWGIKSKKKWVATKDLRTRHDHGMADNQIVDYDQPFDVGGYKMMFPGDGSLGAPGHELYNCRCTVVNATDDDLEAEPHMMRVKNPETGEYELVKKKSYKEWYDEKKAQYPPEKWAGMVKAGKNYQADQRQYADFVNVLGNKAPKTFAKFQDLKYNNADGREALKTAKQVASAAKSDIIKAKPEIKPVTLSLSNLEELEKWQNEYYATNSSVEFTKKANPNISKYSGGAYSAINAVERGGAAYEKALRCYGNLDGYKAISDGVSAEISKFKLSTDLNVKRVVGDVGYITGGGSSVDDMVASIGKLYTEKGFTSTTIAQDAQLPFGGYKDTQTVLDIIVPKSTRGAYIYKMADNPAEFEFLIDRGTTYKVLDAGERTVRKSIFDLKSREFVEKEVPERYMKLEVVSQ